MYRIGAGKETLELLTQPVGWLQELAPGYYFWVGQELEPDIRPRKKPISEIDSFRGAGKETLTPGLILGKDAL